MEKPKKVKEKISSKRDAESLDDFFKNPPIPKVKPKAEQKKDIKWSDEKVIAVENVVKECFDALKEYDLINLVQQAKTIGFKEIRKDDKELLCDGIIKLGEALTFCRNDEKAILIEAHIIKDAQSCAKTRNYFVHHYLYDARLNKHIPTQTRINDVARFINEIENKLKILQKYGSEKLTKPIETGSNDFDFNYSHFVVCLKAEFADLRRIWEIPDCVNKINFDKKLRTSLNNHIRNILVIMVDLTDVNSINNNKDDPSCSAQKTATKNINKEFRGEFKQLAGFFDDLKEYRNSLCHLDDSLEKPYSDTKEMLEFVDDLLNIEKSGYVNRLEQKLSKEYELEKKAKQEEKPKDQKEQIKKEEVSVELELLKGYGSDEEKKQESQTTANVSTPRMGGHS